MGRMLLRAYPAVLATTAAAALARVVTIDGAPGTAWRLIALTGGVAAAVIARVSRRAPWLVVGGVVAAGLQIAGRLIGPVGPLDRPWPVSSGELIASAMCSVALIAVVRRRAGGFRKRDGLDLLAILTGVAIVAWSLIVVPLVESGTGFWDALVAAAFLPTPILLVTLTSNLLFAGLARNRTVQLLVAASWVATAAAAYRSLAIVDVVGWGHAEEFAGGAFIAGYLLACAAVVHPSAPEVTKPLRTASDPSMTDTPARLTLTAPPVLAAVLSVAAVPPRSSFDLVVRLTGTLLIVTAIVVRQYVAMRDDRSARRELFRQAHRDELTGLPTRRAFLGQVTEDLDRTWRTDIRPSIVKLDIDRFTQINDSLGHENANRVLRTVAERVDSVARQFGAFAARDSGDGFVLVDGSTVSADDAVERAVALRTALTPPISAGNSTVFVTASFGVVLAPRQTILAENLIRRADIAAHEANELGGDQVVLFDDSMEERLAQRVDIEHALRGALDRGEMHLYYQPILAIDSGHLNGFEALIRWERDGNIVSPAAFVPIAEETGIINELGTWALHTALSDLRRWIDDGIVGRDTSMSVNVSPRQIADPAFADIVRAALDATGLPPRLMWLEMTESMMLQEPELARTTLRSTAEMGVRLALDDFGTGYSSLSLLQHFPIDRLKIDRSFVSGVTQNPNDRSLVRTIVAMAESMQLDMVAEGVETIEQLGALRDLGCTRAQGFLISRPVPQGAIRSTMVGLGELATLPVFGDAHPVADRARDTPASAIR